MKGMTMIRDGRNLPKTNLVNRLLDLTDCTTMIEAVDAVRKKGALGAEGEDATVELVLRAELRTTKRVRRKRKLPPASGTAPKHAKPVPKLNAGSLSPASSTVDASGFSTRHVENKSTISNGAATKRGRGGGRSSGSTWPRATDASGRGRGRAGGRAGRLARPVNRGRGVSRTTATDRRANQAGVDPQWQQNHGALWH